MKLNLHKLFYLLFSIVCLTVSCKKDYESIEEISSKEIETYINDNKLTVQQYNNTGIYYQILAQGTGNDLQYSDQVFVTFTAKSIDGQFSMQADSTNRYASFL